LYKDSLAGAQWTVKKYQISRATLVCDFFTEGSHLIDVCDAVCASLTSAHNG
jgi:hypothetical protein